jgi:hypothetical protein
MAFLPELSDFGGTRMSRAGGAVFLVQLIPEMKESPFWICAALEFTDWPVLRFRSEHPEIGPVKAGNGGPTFQDEPGL